MTIPPFLIVTCCLAMMALGIYVVYEAIRHPPLGGPSQMSLFGASLVLKGPAWLVMIGLGAAIAATPIVAAVVQRNSQAPFQPPVSARVVATIREPEYRDFRFVRDISYLDLRNSLTQPWYTYLPGWKRVAGRHSRIRPASLLNYMLVRKIGPADTIHIAYSTSGLLDLRCLTQTYSVQTSYEDDQNVGDLIIDVGSIPINSEFAIITELTYWDAFGGKTGDDFTTYSHNQQDQPEDVSVVLIFPDAKPFTEISALEQPPGNSTMRIFEGVGQNFVGPRNQTYYWSTTKTGIGRWFYTIRWKW